MNGIIVIDKPGGFTSFDVVAVMRKVTGQRKIGHCGTLDPNATGVLPLLLGNATRAQDIIPNHDKEYIASLKFGITTDTLDIWGDTVGTYPSNVTREELENTLARFRGEIEQIPPMYSAIQVDGKRLYDLARKGVEVDRQSRKITIYRLELLDFNQQEQTARISVACSKGTYIRSLIDDIGKKLGCGAVMTELCRTMACGYAASEAVTLEQAKTLAQNGGLEQIVKSVESLFKDCKAIYVSEKQAVRFSNGGALDLARTALANSKNDGEIIRVCTRGGEFIGLGAVNLSANELRIYKLFNKI